MKIERLGADEVARFREIRLQALRDAPGAFGTRFEDASRWAPEAWETLFASMTVFVAVAAGTDVGMVRWGPDARSGRTGRLGSLWVAPHARGQGVGDALIDAVVEWSRARGCTELVLDVSDDNQPAIELYARRGFEPNGDVSRLPSPREHLTKHGRTLKLQGTHF